MSTAVQLFAQFTDEQRFNILRPTQSVLAPSPLHTVYAEVVQFTEDDTYPVDGGRVALNGRALSRVASGAGISIINVVRHDDGSNPDYAEVSVLAVMKRPDGTLIHATGKKSVDVDAYIAQQVASQTAKGQKKPAEIKAAAERDRLQLRKYKVERAETGAKNRAIRQLLAMKAAYTRAELAKPFVIPQITLNMVEICRDADGRRMAIQQALGATTQLYGQSDFGQPAAMALPAAQSAPVAAAALMASTQPSQHDRATHAAGEGYAEATVVEDELPALPADIANGEDLAGTIRKLFAEREHGRNDAALGKMLEAPADKQQSYIDWLAGFPKKAGADTWHPSEKQLKRLFAIAKGAGFDSDSLHAFIAEQFAGITSVSDLTREQYDALCGDEKSGTESLLLASKKGGDDGLPF